MAFICFPLIRGLLHTVPDQSVVMTVPTADLDLGSEIHCIISTGKLKHE